MFGCDKILFKLKETGDCVFYERAELNKAFGTNAANWNFTRCLHHHQLHHHHYRLAEDLKVNASKHF